MMRCVVLWYLVCVLGVLPALAQADKGILSFASAASDRVQTGASHRYRLPDALSKAVSIIMEGDSASLYGMLVDADDRPVEPAARAFEEMRWTYVYALDTAVTYAFVVAGDGEYTLSLYADDLLKAFAGSIEVGGEVRGQLPEVGVHLYDIWWAAAEAAQNLITVELARSRPSIILQILAPGGPPLSPLAERQTSETLTQVYRLEAHMSYRLRIYGFGDYRLLLLADDMLRELMGLLLPGVPASGTLTDESHVYRWRPDQADQVISVQAEGRISGITLHDRDGSKLDTVKQWRSGETYTAVYRVSGSAVHEVAVWGKGDYRLVLLRGDASLLPAEQLFANDVRYRSIAPAYTPVYVLDVPPQTSLEIVFVLYGGTVYDPVWLFTSADGLVTAAVPMPLAANRLIVRTTPLGEPPFTLVPAITGAHVAAAAASGLLTDVIPVRLTTDGVNLRGGPLLDAPVLREGALGEVLRVIGRNAAGDWLLALDDAGLVVWVFRQLVMPLGALDLSQIPLAPGLAAVVPAPTPVATSMPTAMPSPAPTLSLTALFQPATPAIPTPTALPPVVCTISSGGGVNLRTGPGVTYVTAGALTAGQIRGVIGQSDDNEENVWWQLADATWVRADLVQEIGACSAAPRIEVSE